MGFRVAVAGATGAVGHEILNILAEREFPADEVVALASRNSVGKEVSFGDKDLKVKALEDFDFAGFDLALFSPGGAVSAVHAPRAAAAGCLVVDNTSHFRMEQDIPLVVPEVNREALQYARNRNIVANPNCSTIQMVMALKPLHDLAQIKRIVVSTYQSTSGAGQKGMDELFEHTKAVYMNDLGKKPTVFSKPIAFNVIPQIDQFMEDGSTKEEWKMRVETKKILDPSIEVVATCVRVPVFIGHALSVNVEFESPIDLEEAIEALQEFEGVNLLHDSEDFEYATPKDAVGEDGTFVSRLRIDDTVPYGLNMWIVADNLRKGAALNAVQIAEALAEDGYL